MDIYASSNNRIFSDSHCMFIEFHDVLAMPWYPLMYYLPKIPLVSRIFQTEYIETLSFHGLMEWYMNRTYQNPLQSLGLKDEFKDRIKTVNYDNILSEIMGPMESFYQIESKLDFRLILESLFQEPHIVDRVILYTPYYEKSVESIAHNGIGKKNLEYQYGDLKTIIPHIHPDTTYVFSDIAKVNVLVETNHLNYSTVLITNGMRYNYTLDDRTKLKVDLDALDKDYAFKHSFFENFNVKDTTDSTYGIPNELFGITNTEFAMQMKKQSGIDQN